MPRNTHLNDDDVKKFIVMFLSNVKDKIDNYEFEYLKSNLRDYITAYSYWLNHRLENGEDPSESDSDSDSDSDSEEED